jgi:hypothetical protein
MAIRWGQTEQVSWLVRYATKLRFGAACRPFGWVTASWQQQVWFACTRVQAPKGERKLFETNSVTFTPPCTFFFYLVLMCQPQKYKEIDVA